MSTYSDASGSDDCTAEHELDHSVLERYWCGEASQDEAAHIEAWFALHPRERVWYEQLRDGVRASGKLPWSRDTRRARTQAIFSAVGISSTPGQARSFSLPSTTGRPLTGERLAQTPFRGRLYAIAATALVIVSLALGWSVNAYRVNNTLATQSSLYSTANGERATIRLPDGTVVILNVASRLTVPGDYSTGNRVVHLDGEALFTVEHERKHPFVVKSGPSTTRVLGTSFVVRHYKDDSVVQVAVRDGKVAVGNVVVAASQRVIVTAHGVGATQLVTGESPFSFENGVLHLERMPLHDAVNELNRWYDVDIRLGDTSLGRAMIGGQFSAGSVLELMEQLTSGLDVQIRRNGRVLTLYRRGM